jgi:diguanylate cyclase (GGDEF)-like protein
MKLFDKQLSEVSPLLIVDDNPSDQELYRQLLIKNKGDEAAIVLANSCEDALELLNDRMPACCLVDYQLPSKTGLDFLKEVRQHEHGKCVPIVIMTGEGDERVAVDIMRNGAQDYLVKSDITQEHLKHSINNAINTCAMQEQLRYLAHYDSLTGLLNRSLFMDRVQMAMDKSNRYQHGFALLYIDVDDFKNINDYYGHQAGDTVLHELGRRLKNNCRITDSPSRLGGDEFAILLDCIDEEQAKITAEKILKAAEEPIVIGKRKLIISLSIGVAYYPKTAQTVLELMAQADKAMYCVKQAGKANYFHFSESLQKEQERRKQLEMMLPKSLKNGELELVYQPIVSAKDHSLHSLEVLSRWHLKDFDVSATELIEMIGRLNLFDEFHDWLVSTSFNQCAKWGASFKNVKFSLNIPADYANSKWLLHCLNRAFETYTVSPPQIALEITETTLMSDPELSSQMLSRLRDQGVEIAIDDFGTGYSSMAYLTTLPLNILKIDQHFVSQINDDPRSQKVVEGIVALGHGLDLQVVAEGIETEAQYRAVKEAGCDLLQGYYLGAPYTMSGGVEDFFQHFPELNCSVSLARQKEADGCG